MIELIAEIKAISIKQVHVGDEITLVCRGKVNVLYGRSYIDPDRVGLTSFVKVSKVGRKYIHGYNIYFEDGNKKTNDCWENEWDLEDYMAVEGIRVDLQKQYAQYRRNREDFRKTREERKRQIEQKYQAKIWEELEAWDSANKIPEMQLVVVQ